MEYLPEDLIGPILKLLPVKSLLRFKCVCKSWFSLISDTQFAKSHFELASAAPTHRLLLHQSVTLAPPLTLFIDLDAPSLYSNSAVVPLDLSFLPRETRSRVMGSCRGFVLIQNSSHDFGRKDLYLWNPSTGLHKHLPLTPTALSKFPMNYLRHPYGFGFDPSTDDYLVLLPYWGRFGITFIEMFSVRNNSWNTYKPRSLLRYKPVSYDSYMGLGYEDAQPGMLFNGILHWLAFRIIDEVHVILAFDLTKRTFSDIPLPVHHLSHRSNLCVLGGLLGLCIPIYGAVQIWAMKQYKVRKSWTVSSVVHYNDHINATGYGFSPICSTKSGDIVGIHGSRLVKCDVNGQLLEHHPSYYADIRFRYAAEAAIYQESLLSLPVVNGQVAEDGQHE